MRILILSLSILCISLLSAATLERFQDTGSGINARFENLRTAPFERGEVSIDDGDEEFPDTPMISRTFAFPYESAELLVNQMTWRVFSKQGDYLHSRQEIMNSALQLSQPFVFREMRGLTLRIQTQVETDTEILTLDNLDFQLQGSGAATFPESLSPAFVEAYRVLADNWDSSYLRNLPVSRPKMLIISHPNLANYQTDFIKWKRSLGFDVYVINKAEAGGTLQEIRETVRTHYLEHRTDYLLLLGDTVGNYSIPTNFFPSPEYPENDADDHYYTLLEGDDYFPEMLVGRFSFNDIMEFIVMATKTVSYEREPFMGDTAWMKRGLAIAGNYAEGNLRPTTPVWMSRWLREKMLDYGYAAVDTVFYPPSYPGTSAITQSINRGVQLISYRGWGDANGWHFPSFHTPDLTNTYNGSKMPIVFSIVCNTGDFANTVNPSFGEAWMRMGTAANLGGCVAFVGPSDLHTKTRLNNSISSGAYRAIMDYSVRGFASSVLQGKLELYKNYPNDQAAGMYVPFYFHVYNILSDPSMNMWILEPGVMQENIIEGGLTFAQSDSHIRINAPHLENAIVSGSKDGISFNYAKVVNGIAILNIDPEEEGELVLTVSKPNWVPLVRTLTVNDQAGIGIIANTGADQRINAGETLEIAITVKNYSTNAYTGISGTIQPYENLEITALNPANFDLAPDATHTLNFQIQANHNIHPNDVLNLHFVTQDPASDHIFQLAGGGAKLVVWNHSGVLDLNQTSTVNFTCVNNGTAPLLNAQVIAESRSEAATIPSTPISIGNIAPGEEVTFNVNITILPNVWDGRAIPLSFVFSDANAYEWKCFYAVTAGTPQSNDPTGPCEYGYFAYDDTDVDYPMAPVYDWFELDPELDGAGNLWLIMDDGVKQLTLPFTFRFFGQDYSSLTISSNGWASFIHTDESYFNNHYIPAALGPYALIAGYWDDLKGKKIGVTEDGNDIFADMRILYWHDAANNRYIVQWNEAYNQYTIQAGDDASLEKFQIILYPKDNDDGDIVLQYHTVDNPATTGNYCTVGI
ncbi:MAG: C25 family cysteine peptidase, partial [Candidatus Cloacimonadaceae bacterium]